MIPLKVFIFSQYVDVVVIDTISKYGLQGIPIS